MQNSITKQQSDAIKITVFLATVLVVIRHGINLHHYYLGGGPWLPVADYNIAVQRGLSSFTNVAVPAFFTISGFLFFLSGGGIKCLKEKLKRRVRTLLIPYLTWNILFIVLWVTLFYIPYFHAQMVQSFGVSPSLQWFSERLTIKPIVGQFWYIRTLMIFCCFSPLLFYVYRSKISSLILLIILAHWWKEIDTTLFSSEGALFFFFGGLISFWKLHEHFIYTRKFLLLIPCILFCICNGLGYFTFPLYLAYLQTLLSLVFLIQLSLYFANSLRIRDFLLKINRYSFFIFALHGSCLAGMSLVLSRILPHTPQYSLLSFFICIIGALAFSIAAAWVTMKVFPRVYGILTGGR